MERSIRSENAEETFALGREIGSDLAAGDIVLLSGGLGAGKTLLTKGIASALDLDVDEVTSPSFTLVNLYKGGNVDMYHIDLWRLEEGFDAAMGVGLEEILESPNSITVIEWPDRLSSHNWPNRTFAISIVGDGDGPREIGLRIP